MSKQQLKIFIMTIIVGAFLALIGTTYAYYQVSIIENQTEKSIDITSKKLSLIYSDGGDGIFSGTMQGYLFPGETFTKTFTVSNDGDDKAKYNIILRDIENTFTRTEDWTYTLKVGNTVLTNPEWITFPTTKEKEIIYTNELSSQTSETYTLIITYANVSQEEQKVDWNDQTIITATIDIEAAE